MNILEYIEKRAAAKTPALDNHPVLKGRQKTSLPDKVQSLIIKKKMEKKAADYNKKPKGGLKPVINEKGVGVGSGKTTMTFSPKIKTKYRPEIKGGSVAISRKLGGSNSLKLSGIGKYEKGKKKPGFYTGIQLSGKF